MTTADLFRLLTVTRDSTPPQKAYVRSPCVHLHMLQCAPLIREGNGSQKDTDFLPHTFHLTPLSDFGFVFISSSLHEKKHYHLQAQVI